MRRLVTFFVLALIGAGIFGLSSASSGIRVNGSTLSAATFRTELSAIGASRTLECYLTALDPVNFTPGAGGDTLAASGAAAWSNLRIEGVAIGQYVQRQFHYEPSASALRIATVSLEGEMTQAAAAHQLNCGGTAAQALAAMSGEMRHAQLSAQAASLYLVSKLNATIPLTTSSVKKYFSAHSAAYDTLCVSVAVVTPARLNAFRAAAATGASVAALAKRFSIDRSAAKGGAYGCYGPTSSSYPSVRADVATTPLNRFPSTPLSISSNGSTFALFVAPTKRTTTPFAQAASVVLADLRNLNASSANTVKQTILYHAAVVVDPAFGRWGLGPSGPTVFAPALPPAPDVHSVATLSTANVGTYK